MGCVGPRLVRETHLGQASLAGRNGCQVLSDSGRDSFQSRISFRYYDERIPNQHLCHSSTFQPTNPLVHLHWWRCRISLALVHCVW